MEEVKEQIKVGLLKKQILNNPSMRIALMKIKKKDIDDIINNIIKTNIRVAD